MHAAIYIILLAGLAAAGAVAPALGTTLNAILDPRADSSHFEVEYSLAVFIEYPRGDSLSELLDGMELTRTVEASSEDPEVQRLTSSINDKIRSDGGQTSVDNLAVEYVVWLVGRDSQTSIDFRVTLAGDITDYAISRSQDRTLIDMGWRGLGSNESIMIDGIDINIPLNVLRDHAPVIYDLVRGVGHWDDHRRISEWNEPIIYDPHDTGPPLSEPLINTNSILARPMADWHYLFVPLYWEHSVGLDDLDAYVSSQWTTAELEDGWIQEWSATITGFAHPSIPDEISYNLRAVQSNGNANIIVDNVVAPNMAGALHDIFGDRADMLDIGVATLETVDGAEVLVVTTASLEKNFLHPTIYVAVSLAAVAGGGLFVVLRHHPKQNGKGMPTPSCTPV